MSTTLARHECAKGEWNPVQTLIGGRKPCEKPPLKAGDKIRNMDGALDYHEITVLPKQEWTRITDQLTASRTRRERQQGEADARHERHQLSKVQIETWPNTISGSIKRKLDRRKAVAEALEEKKVVLDIELDKKRAQERRDYIDRAKTQIYYNTHRVKDFNRALHLTEIIKTREAQVRNNKMKHDLEVQSDIAWGEEIRQNYLNSLDNGNEERKRRKEAEQHTVDYQQGQIDYMEKMRKQDAANKQMEAESIMKDVAHYLEEERCKTEEREHDLAVHTAELTRHYEGSKYMKKIYQAQIEEEEEEARIYAEAKRRMIKLGIEKERQIAGEKAKRVAEIYKHLEDRLRSKLDLEDIQISQAQEELEAKRVKEEERKERKRLDVLKSIEEHRIEDAKYKKKVIEDEKMSDLAIQHAKHTKDMITIANEEKILLHRRAENIKFSKYQLVDAEEHLRVINQERVDDGEMRRREEEHVLLDEKQFHEYACSVMKHCAERGREIYPMELSAQRGYEGKQRPRRYCDDAVEDTGKSGKCSPEKEVRHVC